VAEHDPIAERVADLSTSFVMTSGAGCGKTYRMVQRYTAIIEAGHDVTRIIAVTFTEKAAAELKSRVREKCREMMAQTEGEERAVWERAARRLAMAPVTTIHGLCARLLRENAIAAGIDPHFRQLDETEQSLLLRDALRRTLLNRVHAGEASAQAVVARWGLEGAGAVIRSLIGARDDLSAWLREPPAPETLLARWQEALAQAQSGVLADALGDERWQAVCEVLSAIAPVVGDNAGDRQRAFCEYAATAMAADVHPAERLTALEEALGQGHRAAGAKSKWAGREDELAEVKAGLKTLADLKDEYRPTVAGLAVVEDRATAGLAAALCAEAAAAADAYAAEKRSRSALDFDDLEILARDLLAEHPEVLARVRSRYDYVLVDEFQDTNHLQKQIIWRIAGGNADTGEIPRGGVLFVVGDAKQSIYGFRKADVTVFNATLDEFRAAGPGCDVLTLADSRRSRAELVAFHNAVFRQECVMGSGGEQFEAVYETVGAVREAPEMAHDVELLLVSSEVTDDEAADRDAASRLSADQARRREAEALAARIRQIVAEAPFQVYDTKKKGWRAPQFGDFAILFQAMTSVGIYEYALRHEGIPYYTVAGRGFYNRQEIRDCLSLLCVLENTSDSLSLVGALRSPMFALSDDTIFWLTRGSAPLWRALVAAADGSHPHQQRLPAEQLERIRRARELIADLRAHRDRLSLSELVERMLAQTGLAAMYLSQFAGRQAVANLRKLTDLARSFEQSGEFSLREFIGYLRDLVLSEYREGLASVHEEAEDVVQLLTVHKAKGLEWPIVVVPDLTRDPGGSRPEVMASRDLGPVPRMELADGKRTWGAVGRMLGEHEDARAVAERRRLLYVALTRARDHLILSSSYGLKSDGRELAAGLWLQWLSEALGVHPDDLEDGEELAGEGGWRCRILRPGGAGERSAAEAPPARAPLEVIDLALASARRGEAEAPPELVRPIRPGPHLPARFSVTALQRYRSCPRMFELRHVLGVPERGERGDWLHRLSAFERGDLAHKALEIIGREGLARADAIDRAVALATFPGGVASRITEAERTDLAEALRWVIEEAAYDGGDRIYEHWVAASRRLRAEVDFVLPLGDALIEGTIDALVEGADGAWRVLDYKTGREPSAAALEGYRFQVGFYCAAVKAITGRVPADAALVLLDARRVIGIDPEADARAALSEAGEIIASSGDEEFARRPDCCRERCPLAHACELA